MSSTTIKLTEETKLLLDQIQKDFGIKTYDLTVSKCATFIIRNEINLREDYIGDYKKGLIDLENRILAKFQSHEDKILSNNSSLRKWVGGVEKDYFKPLLQKLNTLDKLENLGFDKILEDKLNSPKVENPLNPHIKTEEKEISKVEESRADTSNKDEKFKEIYGKYEAQKQALFKIFNNSKAEAEGMLSKERIIVNLTAEEWEEIKKLS